MNKAILRLAIPNILSNLSVPLLSSVDTAIVGHLEGAYFLGAIAIGSMIFNFIYWGFGFLRMGTTGLTAQAYGKGDNDEVVIIFYRSLIIAVGIAVIILLFKSFLADVSFFIIDASGNVERYARSYFEIRIFAAPATLALYVFHGWFFGIQNARIPLALTVLTNVVNIIANLFFVYGLGMKSDGVALGTVCAQYTGLVTAVVFFIRSNNKPVIMVRWDRLLDFRKIKRFMTVNFDIFIRTLLLVFAFSFFTAKSAEYGDDVLAANTILLNLWTIFAYGLDGFAFAAESLIGKYVGAANKLKLKLAVKLLFTWSISLAIIFSLVIFLFDDKLIFIFTDNEKVLRISLSFMLWTTFAPVINCICYIWDGIYIGATATGPMRNAMIFCTLVFFLPVYYLTNYALGNNALWLALTLFMFIRGFSLSILSPKFIFNKL